MELVGAVQIKASCSFGISKAFPQSTEYQPQHSEEADTLHVLCSLCVGVGIFLKALMLSHVQIYPLMKNHLLSITIFQAKCKIP